jgi:CRP-like cAMP-binding protein
VAHVTVRAVLDLLRKEPFFANFDAKTLTDVAAHAHTIDIKERAVVWREGDVADRLLLLVKGRCKLRRLRRDHETIIDVLVPGEVAGDVAFAVGENYTSDLVALRKSYAVTIPMQVVRRCLNENPMLTTAIVFSLGQKMLRLYRQLDDLAGGSVESRLARLLLRLTERIGEPFPGGTLVPVKLRRGELAIMAATSLESVSRTLRRWDKDGVLVLQPVGFVVKDRRKLNALAG